MPLADRGRPPPGAAPGRVVNRAPLTPKVAAKGPPVITPLARRPQSAAPTLANQSKEDIATPVSSFLASNVTPRSGPRQNRVESTSSTPNGTPNPDRTSDGWDSGKSGLGITVSVAGGDNGGEQTDSKFFYASDARSQQPAPPQKSTPVQQKQANFFYANGAAEPTKRTSPPANPPIPSTNASQESLASKFFYANGTPDIPAKPNFCGSGAASTVSTSSRMAPSGRPTSSYSTPGGSTPAMRPASPVKTNSNTSAPILRAAMSPVSPNRNQPASQPVLGPAIEVQKGKRRVSIETPPKLVRGNRSESTVGTDPPFILPKLTISPNASEGPSPPLSPGLSQTSMTMASLLHMADSVEEERESDSELQSPTKSQFSDAGVSDLVANARRERKVQDLEITNASLEAINRTLERQLRKQTAELRRFRRLSRSGRLSLTSAPNSRVVSEALTDPAVDLSELSEEEESEEELDSLDDSEPSMPGSPSGPIDSPVALRRKRDEIRLQLDLSKHQELLIDSQKMNQSIKRCLNWTEVLIKEGQKALDYTVRVSDVDFGGRVLAPHLEEDEEASFVEEETVKGFGPGLEPPWSKGPQDRDSGIELRATEGTQQQNEI